MMNKALKIILTKYRTVLVLAIIMIAGALLSSSFLSLGNFLNVIRQVSIIAVLAAGMTFIILTGGIDLSIGSVVAVAGAFSASVLAGTGSTCLAILVGLAAGAAFGVLNGWVIVKENVPPFIVTLATMAIARGVVLVFTNGSPIAVKIQSFKFIGKGYLGGIPFPVIILLAVYLISFYILQHTRFGRNVYCLGGNREATRLSGVNVEIVEFMTYLISGLLAGLTGIVLTARLGSAQPTAGTGYELDAIAAVILGGTSMTGGQGFIFSTVIGALILGFLSNLLVLMNINPFATNIVKGIVILLAVIVDNRFKKIMNKN